MYGTVARMHVKAGMEGELERMSQDHAAIPGMVFQYAYRMDADPQEFYLAVGFESEEAYRKNAESPEQHARYEQYMQFLDAEPESVIRVPEDSYWPLWLALALALTFVGALLGLVWLIALGVVLSLIALGGWMWPNGEDEEVA